MTIILFKNKITSILHFGLRTKLLISASHSLFQVNHEI